MSGEEAGDCYAHEVGPMDDVSGEDASMMADPQMIQFFVAGDPVPQGSTRSFYIKKIDRVVTTHTNRNTEQWRHRIATEAQKANESRERGFFIDDRKYGYEILLHFHFSKPQSMSKKHWIHTKRPDLDKLVRAALDGITGVLIPDDAQVTSITASKDYCQNGTVPGLHISVRRLED